MKCPMCDGKGEIHNEFVKYMESCGRLRESGEQTNEEYYTQTTADIAKLLACACNNLLQKVYEDGGYVPREYDEEDSGYWLEWLKEIHQ